MATQLQIPTEIDLPHFISKESHDLKSPFNRILGFLKLVIRGMDGPISDQARDDLSTAYQNSVIAMVLMNGLVQMSRLSRGEWKLSLVEISVENLLQHAVSDWKKQSSKDQAVEITYSSPEITICADEMVFRQCLLNWISYVAEYAQEDTQIHIAVEAEPQACAFTIRSSGKKLLPPPDCDLTMYGYIARQIIGLHQGELRRAEEDENGALIQFAVPNH